MQPLYPAWRAARDPSLLRPADGTCRYPLYVRLDNASLPFSMEAEEAGIIAAAHPTCASA